jgi:hypothetical protein
MDLVDSGQSWTVNELVGMFLMVAGADTGVIVANTANTLTISAPAGSTMASKAYEIIEPKTTLTGQARADLVLGQDNYVEFSAFKITPGGSSNGARFRTAAFRLDKIQIVGAQYGVNVGQCSLYTNRIQMTYVANCTQRGLYISESLTQIYSTYVKSCTNHNIYLLNCPSTYMLLRSESSGQDGVHLLGCGSAIRLEDVRSVNNTRHGLFVIGTSRVAASKGDYSGNGEWGIRIDTGDDGDRYSNSFLSLGSWAADVPVGSNGSGGVYAAYGSRCSLYRTTGTNTGPYGLKVAAGSWASIDQSVTVTGATANGNLGGSADVTWATDLPSNGDSITNVDTSSTIERRYRP